MSISMRSGQSSLPDMAAVALDQFDLSTRTRNCLSDQNITTVGQLLSLTAVDILAWPKAGKKTLRELQELLGTIGLNLHVAPATPPTILLEHAAPDVQKRLIARLKLFPLSTRAQNVLVKEKFRYLGEIVGLDHRTLRSLKHSGRRTAAELATLVEQQGFQHGTRIPDWSQKLAAKLEGEFSGEIELESVNRSSDYLVTVGPVRWSRLSEQIFRFDKWSLCRGHAAKRMGSGVK